VEGGVYRLQPGPAQTPHRAGDQVGEPSLRRQVDPRAPPPRADGGGWRPVVGQHQRRATAHLHHGAVAVAETAEDQPAGYITTWGGGNGARRHWSRDIGGRDGPSDEPHPHRGSRAGDCPPSTGRVAGPSHAQLTTALPNWAATPNGVAQLQVLDVLTRAEAQHPGITTRPVPWTSPGLLSDENFPPALYVGAPGEYAVGGADPTSLLSLTLPAARAMLARRLSQLPAHTGTGLNEQVRAPIFNIGACEIWVNGKPLEGFAILDTGAMPLLIGRAGMRQMGWTDKDAVPNAVRLGLANGHSTNMHVLTRRTAKFESNPGSPTKIAIAVRAVVTDAPCDFLVGNIILWTIGATLDFWREELHYRVDWLKGPSLADDREGRSPSCIQRTLGPRYCPLRSSAPLPE
jgi:hypothetical protein